MTGDTAADSLIQLNNYRAKLGLPALVANSGVAQAASNHAKYNHLNNAFLHDETPGKPGFTAANFFDRISQYIVANWGGEVAVTGGIFGNRVRLEVKDTGPGFALNTVPEGHGIHQLSARLTLLYGPAAHLEATHDGTHSSVRIILPSAGGAA